MSRKPLVVFFALIYYSSLQAQVSDTGIVRINESKNIKKINWDAVYATNQFTYRSFIIPAFMIAYGVTTIKSDGLQDINENIKEEIWAEYPHKQIHIDNFLQFTPAAAVYALNIAGIKGKNNIRDRSMIYIMSNLITNSTVFTLKTASKQQRPDGSSFSSFPSGHTAEAFASAEFLRQEYKDVSPWYGIAGYAIAAATGLLRMYNNKHWLSDVVAGAGIGIASTKIAYWIYPAIKRTLFKERNIHAMLMPYYQNKGAGLSFVYHLQ